MRKFIAIGFAASIMTPVASVAEVSADLVFCSKLGNPRERIACYDAAARIATRNTPVAASRAQRQPEKLISREVADRPAPAEIPTRNRFAGGFAAIGGGYGLTSARTANVFAFPSSLNDTIYAAGWSAQGAIGYNATIGRFLMGVELSGRWGHESGSASTVVPASTFLFPAVIGFQELAYSLNSNAGTHIAARFGVILDDTLLFAKLGVGASHVRETAVVDSRSLATCTASSPIFPFQCIAFATGTLTTQERSAWVPSLLVGAGIEHNVGAVFVRGQGEVEIASLRDSRIGTLGNATSDLFWTARAMAAIGIRF